MATQHDLPTRSMTQRTGDSDDEAIPSEDTSEVTRLFSERLQAWKHAVSYLEDYIQATEKMQHAHGKEYEKVLKTVSHPLKEGHHFDQSVGGIAGMFDNIRSNTQGISNSHYETAKVLKGSVLPIFERLHSEIKNKNKELTKGAGKGSKVVDKARNSTQKHIELLGQHTATFDSAGGKLTASDDPYILRRNVMYHLHKQVLEENNNRQDLLSVQNSFAQFEAHIVSTIQTGMGHFNTAVSSQHDQTKNMYGDMASTAQRISPDFEWNGFLKRNGNVLIDPSTPARDVSNISFPNMDHPSTQPLIAGTLEKKSKLRGYNTFYYVVTPSKFLHEFKTDDDTREPDPETSLYLPDCSIGALDGQKFNVKGKDVSGGKLSAKFGMSHEFVFKAHTPQDAQRWYDVIRASAGQTTMEVPDSSAPSSPVAERKSGVFGSEAGSSTATGSQEHGAGQGYGAHDEKSGQGLRDQGVESGDRYGGSYAAPGSGVERQPGQY
ncbi:hypothetical protein H2199_005919 [Coniosporium tulheliwenetii]|uniref:Uncharacterized protein n=1 Tax=Coniosporium tulheliwenetii TaxID=3383036 RepID=A0ACC2YZA6_9PEZI|nr:hypothetical protein H2199_005919 [Cladosporium sp. JES 115]